MRTNRRWLLAILSTWLLTGSVAFACSWIGPRTWHAGWLGYASHDTQGPTAPTNLLQCGVSTADDVELWGMRCERLDLERADSLFWEAPLGDYVDEVAPTISGVEAVAVGYERVRATGSCSGSDVPSHVGVGVDVVEDWAPSSALTFAVWFTSTPEPSPTGEPTWIGVTGGLWGFPETHVGTDEVVPVAVMESLAPESEVWVTVQVADQAGNLSGFSQPVRVDTTSRAWPSGPEGGGCSVGGTERGRGLVLFALVALVAMRRRGVRGWRS